jgi:hypothetical protein
LAVASEKTAAGQRDTAVLTRYPQLHRRVEMVLALSLAELLLVFAAPLMFVISLFAHWGWWVVALTAIATILQSCLFGWLQRSIFPRVRAVDAYAAYPWAMLWDIVMLHYSMYAYEFSSVRWRDRNVTYPVMRRR